MQVCYCSWKTVTLVAGVHMAYASSLFNHYSYDLHVHMTCFPAILFGQCVMFKRSQVSSRVAASPTLARNVFFLSTGHTHVLIGRCIVVLDGGAASTWLTPPWRSRCMQRCTRLRQIWLLRTNESMQEQKKLIEIFNHYYKAYLADQSMRREWFAVVVVVVVARLATDVRTRLDGGSRTSSSSPSPMSDQSHQSSLMPKTMLDRTKAAVSHRRSSSPLRQIDQVGSRISSL